MIMSSNKNIPCSSCKLWKKQIKKFVCNPNQCETLSDWLLDAENQIVFEVRQRECQYIV